MGRGRARRSSATQRARMISTCSTRFCIRWNRSNTCTAWGAPSATALANSVERSRLTNSISGCAAIQVAAVGAERSGKRSRIRWLSRFTRIAPNCFRRRNDQSSRPSWETSPTGGLGTAMIRRRIVIQDVGIKSRAARREPSLPQVARPISKRAWVSRAVMRAHGSRKGPRRSGYDFPGTRWRVTEELADAEQETHLAPAAGHIRHGAVVAAMDPYSRSSTERARRGGKPGGHGNRKREGTSTDLVDLQARGEQQQCSDIHEGSPPRELSHASRAAWCLEE